MFRKRRLTTSASGSNSGPNRREWIRCLPCEPVSSSLPANRQRIADSVKILLDVAKESSSWLPPLESALGGVNALIKHYEVFVLTDIVHNLTRILAAI